MATTRVNELTDIGAIAVGDKVVGERVDGTTVRITYTPKTIMGTTDKITVTNGDSVSGDPTITIAATYAGQTSIATIGTISTGVWQGTPVSLSYGGTGANIVASNGGIFYSNATTGALLSGTATASKMLLSGSSDAPTWSTSTIPSSAGATANKVLLSDGTNYALSAVTFPNAAATVGKIIRSDGSNWAASTATFADTYAVSTILYASSANTVAGLATANSGVLVTSAGGVPSIATDIPTAVTIGGGAIYRAGGTDVAVADGGTNLSSYTQGDIIYASGTTTLAKLAKDANATRYLANTGTTNNPAWAQVDVTNGVTGSLPVANGGSGRASATAYAILCGGTTSTSAHQSIASVGNSGEVLTSGGAGVLPTFQAAPAGTEVTQAEQEAATNTTHYVSAAKQQFHPSAAKFWAEANGAGTSTLASYNLTSLTDTGTGKLTFNIGTDFSSANWSPTFAILDGAMVLVGQVAAITAGTVQINANTVAAVATDPSIGYSVVGFGDQ